MRRLKRFVNTQKARETRNLNPNVLGVGWGKITIPAGLLRRSGIQMYEMCLRILGREDWSTFWKDLFIDYHHHPMITEAGIHPCDLNQFPLVFGLCHLKQAC